MINVRSIRKQRREHWDSLAPKISAFEEMPIFEKPRLIKKRRLTFAMSLLLVGAIAIPCGYAVYRLTHLEGAGYPTDIPAFAVNVKPAEKTYSKALGTTSISLYKAFSSKVASSYLASAKKENRVLSFPDLFVEASLIAYLGGENSRSRFCGYVGATAFDDVIRSAREISLSLGTRNDKGQGGAAIQTIFSNGDSSDVVAESSTKSTSSGSFFAWIDQVSLSKKALDYFLKQNDANVVGENTVPSFDESFSDVALSSYAFISPFSENERLEYKQQFSSGSHKMTFTDMGGSTRQVDYIDRSSSMETFSGEAYSGVSVTTGLSTTTYYLPNENVDLLKLGSWAFDTKTDKKETFGNIRCPYYVIASQNDLTSSLNECSSLSLSEFYVSGHQVRLYDQTETIRFDYAGFGGESGAVSDPKEQNETKTENVISLEKPFGVVNSLTVSTEKGDESLPVSLSMVVTPVYK